MTPAIRLFTWANVLVFALQSIWWPDFNLMFQLSYVGADNFRPYQLFTYSLMHGDIWHLFFNVFIIVMFGNALEKVWGFKRMLKFYVIVAVGAASLHTGYMMYQLYQLTGLVFPVVNDTRELANWAMEHPTTMPREALSIYFSSMVGASGVVFGILVAFAYLFPTARLSFLLLPIPIRAKWLVIAYVAVEAYLAFVVNPNDNIAHFAHLGGGLFGFLVARWWKYVDVDRRIAKLR